MMNKCPCEDCLVLAMCKGDRILQLILKCDILLDYIQDARCATKAIETILPPYYDKRKMQGKIPSIVNSIVDRAIQKRHNSHKKKDIIK